MMDNRKKLILEAIIRYFTESGTPVGSKMLSSNFDVSSATIRSEMLSLEKEGYLYQPHTSSGRVPTEIAYRMFVDECIDPVKEKKDVQNKFEAVKQFYLREKAEESVYDVVAILSQVISDVSFGTIPDNDRTYYMGMANLLKQPEFIGNMPSASQVIEILEKGFFDILKELDIDDTVKIFIGKENIIPEIQSCSMLAIKYQCHGYDGVLGILGPMRMNYSYNIAALEMAAGMLNKA